jgi:hypothetical protein
MMIPKKPLLLFMEVVYYTGPRPEKGNKQRSACNNVRVFQTW